MTNDFGGPKRPANDPIDTVTSFLSGLGGALADALENAFDTVSDLIPEAGAPVGKLPVEVKLLEDGALAKFDLPPGVGISDVTVDLEDNRLEVSATRRTTEATDSIFSDRRDNFYRGVDLPADKIWEPVSAVVTDGVLEVALSSREVTRSFNIPVK